MYQVHVGTFIKNHLGRGFWRRLGLVGCVPRFLELDDRGIGENEMKINILIK